MNVGDLVKYGDWYTGEPAIGIILESTPDELPAERHYLVCWFGDFPQEMEWETHEELEVLHESG